MLYLYKKISGTYRTGILKVLLFVSTGFCAAFYSCKPLDKQAQTEVSGKSNEVSNNKKQDTPKPENMDMPIATPVEPGTVTALIESLGMTKNSGFISLKAKILTIRETGMQAGYVFEGQEITVEVSEEFIKLYRAHGFDVEQGLAAGAKKTLRIADIDNGKATLREVLLDR